MKIKANISYSNIFIKDTIYNIIKIGKYYNKNIYYFIDSTNAECTILKEVCDDNSYASYVNPSINKNIRVL